jgi:ubiquinone/menaquinone biosynthesis C-methylase UbiE
MLKRFYCWLHRKTSDPKEANEYSAGRWQDMVRKEALKLLSQVQGRLLEIGCGEGLFLAELARQDPGLEIWGVDFSQERLKQAEERIKALDIKNVSLALQEAPLLDFPERHFDRIVCVNVIFNMPTVELVKKTFRSMERVCKNEGRVIFDFRNSQNPLLSLKYRLARFYDPTLKGLALKAYSLKEIESMLNDEGLKIERLIPVGRFICRRLTPIFMIEASKR